MKITQPKDYIKQYAEESGFKSVEKMIDYYTKEESIEDLLFEALLYYKAQLLSDIKDNLIEG